MNWANVGMPTTKRATVVAHGHRRRTGPASGRIREAANAVDSTTAYKAARRPDVTQLILPLGAEGRRMPHDLAPRRRGAPVVGQKSGQIPRTSSTRTMRPDAKSAPVTSVGVTRLPGRGWLVRAARQ